jgi:hypothetical protein
MAIGTGRKVRVELTPELRALFAFVGPSGARRKEAPRNAFALRDRKLAILCPNQRTQERHYRQHDCARNRLLHESLLSVILVIDEIALKDDVQAEDIPCRPTFLLMLPPEECRSYGEPDPSLYVRFASEY